MEILAVKNAPVGTMNYDDDPHYLHNGDYRKAVGIRHISNSAGGSIAVEDVLGNKFAFTLPVFSVQNKKYRIFIDSITAQTWQVKIVDANASPVLISLPVANTVGDIVTSANDFINGLVLDIFNAGYQVAPLAFVQTGTDTGFVDFELTGNSSAQIAAFEYVLTSAGLSTLTITCFQEAYDPGLFADGVQLQAIHGYYLLGKLYVFSAITKDVPVTLNITSIGNINSKIGIFYTGVNQVRNGQSVQISGAPVATGANGTWIINIQSPSSFYLENSTFAANGLNQGIISLYLDAIGQIGIAEKNESTTVWTYTPIITSKQFGFRLSKRVDSFIKFENDRHSMYWCDAFNPDRVLYYDGPIVNSGALNIFNPLGQYDYTTLLFETALTAQNSFVQMEVNRVVQTGGVLTSGNKVYYFSLVTFSGTNITWSDPTKEINICSAGTATAPKDLMGDPDDTVTGKSVELILTNLIVGLYQFVDIVCVSYNDLSLNAKRIGRYFISQETMTIIHTGNETAAEDFELAQLNVPDAAYINSHSINSIDNRLIRSNLTSSQISDFTLWAKSFRHKIIRREIPIINKSSNNPGDLLNYGEYYDEMNVYNNVGYMMNETEMFLLKVQLTTGIIISTPFPIDTITIDANQFVNIGNPTDNRRIPNGGLPDYSVVNAAYDTAYIPGVQFQFDPNFTIDGIAVKNIVARIFIERVELGDALQEVLASGYTMPFISRDATLGNAYMFGSLPDVGTAPLHNFGNAILVRAPQDDWFIEYQNWRMHEMLSGQNLTTYETIGATYQNVLLRNNYASFYSSDLFLGGKMIDIQSGGSDKVLCFDHQAMAFVRFTGNYAFNGGAAYQHDYREIACTNGATYLEVPIDEGQVVNKDDAHTFSNGDICAKYYFVSFEDSNTNVYDETYAIAASPVLKATASNVFQGTDLSVVTGWIYAQYFRDKGRGAKFGPAGTNKSVPTGASIIITPDMSGTTLLDVFGGDTFSQRTYMRYRFPGSQDNLTSQSGTLNTFTFKGFGMGVTMYSQNRINSQMRYPDAGHNIFPVGTHTVDQWLGDPNDPFERYTHGFDIRNDVNRNAEFNPFQRKSNRYQTRHCWSEKCPNGSQIDLLRQTPPLNFIDLDENYGEVIHNSVTNNELYSFQPYKFMHLYFDSNALLKTDDTSILIGDDGVMRQKGTSLSSFGCRHKWAVIKGKSMTGKDTLYWPDTENGRFMRYGQDGTNNITVIKKMRTFFRMGTKWANEDFELDAPHGIWDERNMEAIWTFRSRKKVQNWDVLENLAQANVGDECYVTLILGGPEYSNFEQQEEIFICTVAHVPDNQNRPLSSDPNTNYTQFWVKVEIDNTDYYNYYTIAYSEIKQGWRTFYPFRPRIYLPFKDTYLSPRPVQFVRELYEHNEGELLVWYRNDLGTPIEQAVNGEINMPTNYEPQSNKHIHAVWFNCLIVPQRIDFSTNNQTSFLLYSDFEYRKEEFTSTVKNSVDVNGANDQDTSPLYGTYLFTKFTFIPRVYQRLVGYIVKLSIRNRDYKN